MQLPFLIIKSSGRFIIDVHNWIIPDIVKFELDLSMTYYIISDLESYSFCLNLAHFLHQSYSLCLGWVGSPAKSCISFFINNTVTFNGASLI